VTIAPVDEADRLADLPLEAIVALGDMAGAIKDGLLAFASATALVVMRQMMETELTERVGVKHAKIPTSERVSHRHGTTTGLVVLGGRQVRTERPRGRTSEGTEVELDTWKVFGSADLLNSLVVERMLAGEATRRHADEAEPVGPDIEARSRSCNRVGIESCRH
jgi:putative transposase